MTIAVESSTADTIPIIAIVTSEYKNYLASVTEASRAWLTATGFRANPHTHALLPDAHGRIAQVLVGLGDENDIYAFSHLPFALPPGRYSVQKNERTHLNWQLSWQLGSYQFTRYKKSMRDPATLVVTPSPTVEKSQIIYAAVKLVRDLVNTPTEELGPAELAAEVKSLAQAHTATYREWVGDELLAHNFPTIHAVGRASHRAPRLAELSWGDAKHPHLVLIGKGVCFDTGGLDLKSADGMRWMKKDMGGAAHAIALAELVLRANLPVRLTLLIPAVENAVAGNAYRPGEVIRTRAGVSVEIDNTDAEGRLVLCDALAYASETKPDLIVDFATLTGAARVALGPDLPALFSNREELAHTAIAAGRKVQDPLWHMPLWAPYRALLDSRIADLANASVSKHAGAITAALYLDRFVPQATPWMHLDTYAWNDADKPGRPAGGEALGLRAFFAMLTERYRA